MDQAYCDGAISSSAANAIKAVIEFGAPTFVAGLSYNVGSCSAQGVSLGQVRTSPCIVNGPDTFHPVRGSPPWLPMQELRCENPIIL